MHYEEKTSTDKQKREYSEEYTTWGSSDKEFFVEAQTGDGRVMKFFLGEVSQTLAGPSAPAWRGDPSAHRDDSDTTDLRHSRGPSIPTRG